MLYLDSLSTSANSFDRASFLSGATSLRLQKFFWFVAIWCDNLFPGNSFPVFVCLVLSHVKGVAYLRRTKVRQEIVEGSFSNHNSPAILSFSCCSLEVSFLDIGSEWVPTVVFIWYWITRFASVFATNCRQHSNALKRAGCLLRARFFSNVERCIE